MAAGALVAAVAGGGEDEPSCNVTEIARATQGGIAVVGEDTICNAEFFPCGRLGLRSCVGGVCASSCTVYYELSDGRRFTCGPLANCGTGAGVGITDPNYCLSAAQQVTQACQ